GIRAVVQLAAVGLVVAAVFRSPVLAPLYLLVVLGAASWTSRRRLGRDRRLVGVAAVAITAGAATAAAIVIGAGALALSTQTSVPFIAQLVGGAMTATSLAGQRFTDDVSAGWAEVEGWLAIGATSGQAVEGMGRRAAARAL